jgi:hypothetical protein
MEERDFALVYRTSGVGKKGIGEGAPIPQKDKYPAVG